MQGAPAILHQPQPLLHKKGLQPSPQTPQPPPGQGLNRSACRSYINVSSTHQRVGMFFIIGPSARSLIAYMSEASLKKGPAWFLSTTLNAGRLCERQLGPSARSLIAYMS